MLPVKAHFTVHHLLSEIHGGAMTTAFFLMCNTLGGVRVTAKVYAVAKVAHGVRASKLRSGSKHTPETIAKISGENSYMYGKVPHNKGVKQTPAQRKVNSEAQKRVWKDSTRNAKLLASSKPNKLSQNNTSGCTGVYYVKDRNIWRARIHYKGVKLSLGTYRHKNDAIIARWSAEIEYNYPIVELK